LRSEIGIADKFRGMLDGGRLQATQLHDFVFNVLSIFRSFVLTGGTMMPLPAFRSAALADRSRIDPPARPHHPDRHQRHSQPKLPMSSVSGLLFVVTDPAMTIEVGLSGRQSLRDAPQLGGGPQSTRLA
jgi:hypothetical protein